MAVGKGGLLIKTIVLLKLFFKVSVSEENVPLQFKSSVILQHSLW